MIDQTIALILGWLIALDNSKCLVDLPREAI
jgi:hypothetical protein